MFDLDYAPQPVAISVMREEQTVCVSTYMILPEGRQAELFYALILEAAMQQAAELGCGLVVEGADNGK